MVQYLSFQFHLSIYSQSFIELFYSKHHYKVNTHYFIKIIFLLCLERDRNRIKSYDRPVTFNYFIVGCFLYF